MVAGGGGGVRCSWEQTRGLGRMGRSRPTLSWPIYLSIFYMPSPVLGPWDQVTKADRIPFSLGAHSLGDNTQDSKQITKQGMRCGGCHLVDEPEGNDSLHIARQPPGEL